MAPLAVVSAPGVSYIRCHIGITLQKKLTLTKLLADWVLVGTTGAILAGVGLLQRSLGDVMGDEAKLPSASSARTKRETNRSKRFLDRSKRQGNWKQSDNKQSHNNLVDNKNNNK
eukprot:jgi/Galph1/3412/GphlegSOOS_G2085.1